MNIQSIKEGLERTAGKSFDLYERRPGEHQLIIPIFHEDADMVDIYLQESPNDPGLIRICDYGLTLMRLSYTYDVNTDSKQRILDGILANNGVQNDNGNLYLDTTPEMLYQGVLQFAGCAQKVCNMRYWSREIVRSTFYEDLQLHVITEMQQFSPVPDVSPIPEYPTTIDWLLSCNNRNFFVFGVRGNDKAKVVAISLLEFQKVRLPFISVIIHEDIEDLGNKERLYLTRNADTQYPVLSDFKDRGKADIERFAIVQQPHY